MPQFSIIIPVYRVEEYLEKCVDSILAQTCQDFELLLIDDGSPDGSGAICDRYAASHPNQVRALHQPNGGAGAARNRGIELAQGDYLLFVDGDDWLAPNLLEDLSASIAATPADLYLFGALVERDGKVTGELHEELPADLPTHTKDAPQLFFGVMAPWNRAYRRTLFTEGGIRFATKVWYEDIRIVTKVRRNLPQVHTIVRMLRMVLEVVCPAVILKGEVVMAPKELAAYFGTPEKPECHMLYNVSTMVNLWSALASRDTRLLKAQLDALHALPKNCWFVNYLRCHDDIGWGLDEAVEEKLGIDPQKHKEYLYHFYEGNFPGSWAKGELYNYDPATGDARSCGTTASLCGVEQALEKNDTIALDYAVKRDLLLHTAMAFLQGFPMLNCGDEIAQRNGWDYKNDPDRVEDSRNLHRSKFNWEDAKQRTRKGTLQNALWQGMEELRKMRADECFSPDAWVTTWDSHNPGVLALVRKRGEETLVGLFNFTEYPAGASLDALGGEYHTPEGASVWLADVELQPYQALLVKKA